MTASRRGSKAQGAALKPAKGHCPLETMTLIYGIKVFGEAFFKKLRKTPPF
ncbi:hypothetical protein K6L44_09470 [Gluconacetobacter entanii]|uniref:hypothetical protein n=1 Tax=Gluconacetobacter entanii TaxID=108528 RepID=UPI001C9326A2|nr:hypothetical protein [Gluconacetobacter entanii]MBY4640210.1 hypothetical protein [Gluconacetobacter entanii]MCW4580786.1 hypothetical protein [Gluconacetobacter entanii]MCW4584115.1 hypothetical protein [Gluconacetobacter entanii]MCW4587422.1 hypothetical protein [Gluconacetobacter entanii]